MLNYIINGDITLSQQQTLVNTVNCVGVMGRGVALAFKRRYPAMFAEYQSDCRIGLYIPGYVIPWRIPNTTPRRIIANFATKNHWRPNSEYPWIKKGLITLRELIQENQYITSLALPKLGCGNGGLSWSVVGPMIVEYLADVNIPIDIYISEGDTQY